MYECVSVCVCVDVIFPAWHLVRMFCVWQTVESKHTFCARSLFPQESLLCSWLRGSYVGSSWRTRGESAERFDEQCRPLVAGTSTAASRGSTLCTSEARKSKNLSDLLFPGVGRWMTPSPSESSTGPSWRPSSWVLHIRRDSYKLTVLFISVCVFSLTSVYFTTRIWLYRSGSPIFQLHKLRSYVWEHFNKISQCHPSVNSQWDNISKQS